MLPTLCNIEWLKVMSGTRENQVTRGWIAGKFSLLAPTHSPKEFRHARGQPGGRRTARYRPRHFRFRPWSRPRVPSRLAAVCADAAAPVGSVAVIAADQHLPELSRSLTGHGVPHGVLDGADAAQRLTLVPVTLAKGLEFDHVIVVEPAAIAGDEAGGLQRLYVALTRAVSRLTILLAEPLPDLLR
jgi:UvrD-like helicase C-terminal domain